VVEAEVMVMEEMQQVAVELEVLELEVVFQ